MQSVSWLAVVFVALLMCACGSQEQAPVKPVPPVQDKHVEKSATVPDTIILDTNEGRITLPHLDHAKKFHCNTCHSEINPGKIAWDKDTAHAYCRDCHTRNGKGPITCTECHKK